MMIREMTATFGTLEKAALTLGPGMNLLLGANEAGKSTWSAFLRAMLYGIPTAQRDKTGFLAEKNRYAPWSGAAMEGSMTLSWQGREILLSRRGKGASPFADVRAVDAATGELIPELCVDRPGEVLLGVEREVFECSAFVGQAAVTVDGAPALEKRIAALLTSGQEEVSFSQVQQQLKAWRNRRQHNKTGLIPKLEEAIAQGEAQLRRARSARLQLEEGQAGIETLREEKGRLEEEKALYQNRAEREKWARLEEGCREYRAAREEYEALAAQGQALPPREELLNAQRDYQQLQTLSAALHLKEEELEREQAAPPPPGRRPGLSPLGAAAIGGCAVAAAVVCVLVGGTLLGADPNLTGEAAALTARPLDAGSLQFLCAGLGAALGGGLAALAEALLRRRSSARRDRENRRVWEERLDALRRESDALRTRREEKRGALLRLVHRFAPAVTNEFGAAAALSRALQGEERLSPAKARLDSARRMVEMLRDTLESQTPPEPVQGEPRYPYPETVARLAVTLEELGRKERMVAAAQGELKSLGDVPALESRLEADRENLRARLEELAALDMAMEAMDVANSAMQARFSPALNRRAGEVLAALTGGKYDQLTLSRTFEAVARQRGEVLPRGVLTLSQGTVDQLYLAVRLAVCDLALPSEVQAPLVLDDALVHFDDERLALALEHLLERARTQQVLLFSCHSRERDCLRGRGRVTVL